ncbi:MAG: hypothetical protein ACI9HY_003637, partial [Planctomycetaceae bacterium]
MFGYHHSYRVIPTGIASTLITLFYRAGIFFG